MEQKLVLIGLAVLLCSGISQALNCYTCTYEVENGAPKAGYTDGCQGDDDFNATVLTPATCDKKCFAMYMKTNDNKYKWERGCRDNCEEKNGGANDWMTCCDTENCNVQKAYPTDPKKLSQCYGCSYTEGAAGQSGQSCKKEDITSDSITKIACNTNCFFQRNTTGDQVTWTRGCMETCDDSESGDDFIRCCSNANLCNGNSKKQTSGCDVIFRHGNLMFASVVVVMTAVLRHLA